MATFLPNQWNTISILKSEGRKSFDHPPELNRGTSSYLGKARSAGILNNRLQRQCCYGPPAIYSVSFDKQSA
jgi:hypothetical protein